MGTKNSPALPGPERIEPSVWAGLSPEEAAGRLTTAIEEGLDPEEAQKRLELYGPNVLKEVGKRSVLRMFADQFVSALVLVLLIAVLVSLLVGSVKDAIAILTVLFLNGILGFAQDFRAEKAIAALRKLSTPMVRVRRGGVVTEMASSGLVPGDVVMIEAGNIVPADGRIVESAGLKISEAVLTGESEPAEKESGSLPGEGPLSLGDLKNFCFMGTTVTYGRGRFLVTVTGMDTELGLIAGLIQSVDRVKSPLQKKLDSLGHALAIAALIVLSAVFGLGLLIGEDWKLMLMTSVSMAVAVIPEGLPAVVTIALALGAQRMLRRNILIRRLPAVETLGSVTVICSDKTGTLTENRMTVTVLDLAGHRLDLSEEMNHSGPSTIVFDNQAEILKKEPALSLLLMGSALCNDAVLRASGNSRERFRAIGDPTEGALVIAAARFGLFKDSLDAAYPRVGEIPFDSDRKLMTTVHRVEDCRAWIGECAEIEAEKLLVFTKGAPDELLKVCGRAFLSGKEAPMNDEYLERIRSANENLAMGGMRVLGAAFKSTGKEALNTALSPDDLENDLVFIGMVGMLDPPRADVKTSVATCISAGIRPVMITGDHPLTARRIASDLGILMDGGVLTGAEMEEIPPELFSEKVEEVSVFARVAPERKLKIVEALQQKGHVVAMTGDGVNDAPALRRADIGVAMGITGTDVSKEAASMVLLDDNFSSIVSAVEEGRAIFDNILRFIKFSLAGNVGKVLLVLLAPLFGLPVPLTPFQILWLNLVTDGVLGLGIGMEPADPGAMKRPPRNPSEGIMSGGTGLSIFLLGSLLGAVNLGVAFWAFQQSEAPATIIIMTTVVILQIVEAHVLRSNSRSVFFMNPLSNKPLLAATLVVIVLQALVITLPPIGSIFETGVMSPDLMAVPLIAGGVVLVILEAMKWIFNRKRK